MPATWGEMVLRCGLSPTASAHDPKASIHAGACYMARLRYSWRRNRTPSEQHPLAQASYNAGMGSILKAQALCGDARLWQDIRPCLEAVTGPKFSHETRTYTDRIDRYWRQMELQ